jgi:uncharacterized protein (TIGR03083 family)
MNSLPAALEHLDAAVAAFAAALEGDVGRPVPGCPGWDVAALAGHLGGIHRWAGAALAGERPGEPDEVGPADPGELRAWFAEGAAALTAALRSTDPDAPCWTFGPPPRTAAFWLRRMPHETTLHAWDAHAALGAELPLDRDLALDGVDEVVTMFVPRQVRLGRLVPPPHVVELRATDAPPGTGSWRLFGGEDAAPDAVVTGPPATLLLLLWKRLAPFPEGITVDGDEDAALGVLSAALTP